MDIETKEKIINALWAGLDSSATSRVLLQTILMKYEVPYSCVCRDVFCKNCPFQGDEELCHAKFSNADWIDIAKKVLEI